VEGGQLGDKDQHHRNEIWNEMASIIAGVEADEKEQNDRHDHKEFTSPRKLNTIINLFPVSQSTSQSLILDFPRSPLEHMEKDEVNGIVNEVGKGPGHGDGEERY